MNYDNRFLPPPGRPSAAPAMAHLTPQSPPPPQHPFGGPGLLSFLHGYQPNRFLPPPGIPSSAPAMAHLPPQSPQHPFGPGLLSFLHGPQAPHPAAGNFNFAHDYQQMPTQHPQLQQNPANALLSLLIANHFRGRVQ